METTSSADPSSLAPGTRIGPWRVVAWCSQGSYGIIYRVEQADRPGQGFFTLKLARYSEDPRFEREAELLSRLHHPHVPRLHDRGEWVSPAGARFPYLVLEWVEGLPLYAWARQNSLTSRQVLRLLAQVARAVAATHAAGGIHRDAKGDNILVRHADTQAMLMDFGSCTFRGASTLTRRLPPPGTPQYSSPESQSFQWRWRRQATARYEASPADDLYALGVTAYRLVTGRYPLAEEHEPPEDAAVLAVDDSHLFFPKWVPAEALVHISPELARLIHQLLAEEPSARGTAEEIALACERAERTARREADHPIAPRSSPVSEAREDPQEWVRGPPSRRRWLALMAACGVLAVSLWAALRAPEEGPPGTVASAGPPMRDSGNEDAGTTGVGEDATTERVDTAKPVPGQGGISAEMPKEPLPDQRRPPCEGMELEINGGCWWSLDNGKPPCGKRTYAWKNRCYLPSFEPPRPSTSAPP